MGSIYLCLFPLVCGGGEVLPALDEHLYLIHCLRGSAGSKVQLAQEAAQLAAVQQYELAACHEQRNWRKLG